MPEYFQPATGDVKFDVPLPPAADASEESTQVAETEAPEGQSPAKPAAPAEKPPERTEPPRGGQQTIAYPPGQEPAQPTPTETPAADATPGGEPTLPFDVLVEAGAAGLTAAQVQALGTADAIRAAIQIKGGTTATTTPAAPGAPATATAAATPKETPPELKPWDVEVPKELEDAELYDPKLVAYLKKLTETSKQRDDAYRARVAYLESRQPQGEATADRTGEMMFDMTLNTALAKEQYQPYADKLGVGWQFEITEEQFENRKALNSVAQELLGRQLGEGRKPKMENIIMQAAGIVFPDISSKIGQKAIAAKLAARPKIGKPGGGVADNRDPRQQAADDIREAQRLRGIR